MQFIHKPENLDKFKYSPIGEDLSEWTKIRKFMKDSQLNLGYVGYKDGFHYFQLRGCDTGFARELKF